MTPTSQAEHCVTPPGSRSGFRRGLWALAVAAGVAWANGWVWQQLNPPINSAEAPERVTGFAYNAFQRWDSPLERRYPEDAKIEADLRLLATLTDRVRTYSSSEFPALPALAAQHGLRVAAGAWLDRRADNNEREVSAAIDAARRHRNIERLVIGNETQLHGVLTPRELYAHLDRARAALRQKTPVTTAEPWHIWLRQPELAARVDFITVHLLPYWEGVPAERAVDEALQRYEQVRKRFPKKRVVIGEIGWPSAGDSIGAAHANPALQAAFVREFVARAEPLGLDYYLMEAVDQPWKSATEGRVGAHWGLHDAARQAKFGFSGPVFADPQWPAKAALASLLGSVAVFAFLLGFAGMRRIGQAVFAIGAQLVASLAVWLWGQPMAHYLGAVDVAMLLLLVPAMVMMSAILLVQTIEFCEMFWDGSLRRRVPLKPAPAGAPVPWVSIHLACCNEPPAMVIATIDSLLALDWPRLEVVVVDNNTRDAALWRPVQEHVQARQQALAGSGEGDGRSVQLRFFHLPSWPGFKAGALNFALEHTDPRAEWVAVVDADYLVRPDWLRSLAGHFADPGVGAVQAPQAHRDWRGHALARMMNWEYEGFFRIGMHHRHERDALVQHGTMTLIRASALRDVGGWSADCICEDTELGLRLMQRRLQVIYVDEVLGTGLVPATFASFRRQRHRWAQGGMQILRMHAGALLGRSGLTLGQRYHFVAGWLPWIGDALHLIFTFGAMVWTVGMLAAPQYFRLPVEAFLVPLAVFFTVRLLIGPLLYWRRVRCSAGDIAGAALAGMGLSHSIARGVFAGLIHRRAVFEVTQKSSESPASAPPAAAAPRPRAPGVFSAVREEAALVLGLLVCAGAMAARIEPGDVAGPAWMLLLGLQALPYAAALACASVCAWSRRQPRAARRSTGRGQGAAPLHAAA